jgi:NTE family protein
MPSSAQQPNVEPPSDDKRVPRIGLCLSGGGFRASFFGLGAVRYLAEAGLLPHLQAVSAVSGGSITAAVLADRWPALQAQGFSSDAFSREVIQPFSTCVASRNLRNRGVGRWLVTRPLPGRRYGSARGETLVKHLLSARTLADLPRDLQVILTSTDLASGRAFRVSQEFMGSWDYNYAAPPHDLRLSSAIAASTAVPAVFPPVHLWTAGTCLQGAPSELSLVDGGVYDNLGLEWFQGWDRGRPDAARLCDYVIVIDASGPIVANPRRFGWGRALMRSQSAQYAQSRMSRIRWFVDQLLGGDIDGLWVPIDKDPRAFKPPPGFETSPQASEGSLPLGFAKHLSRLRTDLDRFTTDETALLMYHGYWTTHVRMISLRPDLAVDHPNWTEFASLTGAQEQRLSALLDAGVSRRLSRA